MKTILIFAYYSFKDPVFQSAVLPYFRNFPNKNKYKFILLTFEQKKFRISQQEISKIKDSLSGDHIVWFRTSWKSGRFKLIMKAVDFISGVIFSVFLILKYRISIVYSEAFPGAIISHYVTRMTNKSHMVHTFEPHADYMMECGVWKSKSWEFKLMKALEKKIAKKCTAIFTATQEYKNIIVSWGADEDRVHVTPSCVDTELFKFSQVKRDAIRKEQKLSEKDCVIAYLGKFGGMYMEEELFHFFRACDALRDEKIGFRFWIFTRNDHEIIWKWIHKSGMKSERFLVTSLDRYQVSSYLSATDFGFVAVRQFPSKRFCSPIKDGEYWATGLPIIIPQGISDDYLLTEENELGVVIKSMDTTDLNQAASDVKQLFLRGFHVDNRNRISAFAMENRSIESSQLIFNTIFSIN